MAREAQEAQWICHGDIFHSLQQATKSMLSFSSHENLQIACETNSFDVCTPVTMERILPGHSQYAAAD